MIEKVLLAVAVLATVFAVLALIGGAEVASLGGFAVAAIGAGSGIVALRERRGR